MRSANGVLLVLGVAVAIVAVPMHAVAEPRVVVLGSDAEAPRTSFVQTLTIQLSGEALVETGPQLAAGSLPERLEEAAGILAERDATLGVWIEVAEANPRTFDLVLYAVGRRRDVALVKVAHVEVAEGDDVDRALALKVGEFLDDMLTVEDPGSRFERVVVEVPVRAPAPPPTERSAGPLGGFVELGMGGVLGGAARQSALLVEAGVQVRRGSRVLEVAAALRAPSAIDVAGPEGRVIIEERAAAIEVRAVARDGRLGAALSGAIGARVLDAVGIAEDGATGQARRIVPVTGGGVEGRFWLGRRLSLRVCVGMELALIDQRFAIDGQEVVAVGEVRATGQVSIVIPLD